jgi:hypothetical protein
MSASRCLDEGPSACGLVIGDKRLSGFNPAEIDAALARENNQAEAASL